MKMKTMITLSLILAGLASKLVFAATSIEAVVTGVSVNACKENKIHLNKRVSGYAAQSDLLTVKDPNTCAAVDALKGLNYKVSKIKYSFDASNLANGAFDWKKSFELIEIQVITGTGELITIKD